MFGLLAAEENTPESRLVLVEFTSSSSVQDPVIKIAGKQSDSTDLSETVSCRSSFVSGAVIFLQGRRELEIFREVMSCFRK
jgi:hypothetical protein